MVLPKTAVIRIVSDIVKAEVLNGKADAMFETHDVWHWLEDTGMMGLFGISGQ